MYRLSFKQLVAVVVVTICGCSPENPTPSLLQVLNDAGKFSGQDVSVRGYLGKHPFHLYLSKRQAEIYDYATSIDVENLDFKASDISDYCGGHYALVEGRILRRKNLGPPWNTDQVQRYYIGRLKRILVYSKAGLMDCWPGKKGAT